MVQLLPSFFHFNLDLNLDLNLDHIIDFIFILDYKKKKKKNGP